MRKIPSLRNVFTSLLFNIRRTLSFAWKTDKFLFVGFYGLSSIGAFFPVLTSFVYKLTIDSIISSQSIAPTVPIVLVALLGGMYLSNLTWDFVIWGFKGTYFDYLFRSKMQNALSYAFFHKVSGLDIAHYENPEVQNLIVKSEDNFTWRVPDFLRKISDLLNNFVSFLSSLIVLIPFGWLIPVFTAIAALPKLYVRTRYGRMEWSIYGMAIP